MSSVAVALGSLLLMLLLIYSGMHVAITLGLLSFIGVWIIRARSSCSAARSPFRTHFLSPPSPMR